MRENPRTRRRAHATGPHQPPPRQGEPRPATPTRERPTTERPTTQDRQDRETQDPRPRHPRLRPPPAEHTPTLSGAATASPAARGRRVRERGGARGRDKTGTGQAGLRGCPGLTLMRPPVVKRQTTPVSGFFPFFPLFSADPLSLGTMSGLDVRRLGQLQHGCTTPLVRFSRRVHDECSERYGGSLRPSNISVPS